MCVYLLSKFEVSSVILASFRKEGVISLSLPPPQNEPLKSQPGLGLKKIEMSCILEKTLVFSIICSKLLAPNLGNY